MTVMDSAVKNAATGMAANPGKSSKRLGAVGAAIIVNVLTAWIGGAAASHGWHVSMPFLPTWLTLTALTLVVSAFGFIVATHWHTVKADMAGEMAAKGKIAEAMAEKWLESYVAKNFAAELAKLGGA